MKQNLFQIRQRVLDLWILGSSLFCIAVGVLMLIYCSVFLNIAIFKPYALYIALICLGVMGLRYYLKEVEL